MRNKAPILRAGDRGASAGSWDEVSTHPDRRQADDPRQANEARARLAAIVESSKRRKFRKSPASG